MHILVSNFMVAVTGLRDAVGNLTVGVPDDIMDTGRGWFLSLIDQYNALTGADILRVGMIIACVWVALKVGKTLLKVGLFCFVVFMIVTKFL